MVLTVKVKLLGVLEKVFATKEQHVTFKGERIQLRDVLTKLQQLAGNDQVFKEFFDEQGMPKRSLIVLVNGATHEALGGVDVSLKDGDEIILLPAIHGGC